MVITHSLKYINPLCKDAGVCVPKLEHPFKGHLCSATIQPTKIYWGGAINARHYKLAVEAASEANRKKSSPTFVPETVYSNTKQMLIRNIEHGYINHSPVPSCALLNEINSNISRNYQLCRKIINIEKIKTAVANHGELGVKTLCRLPHFLANGQVYRSNAINYYETASKLENAIIFTGELHDVLLSAGHISVGVPAITGIGGAIEFIEFKTGVEKLEFAFGIRKVSYSLTAKKGSRTAHGTIKSFAKKPVIVADKITGKLQFCMAVTGIPDDKVDEVTKAILQLTNIAGGMVLNMKKVNEVSVPYHFITDYSFTDRNLRGDILSKIISERYYPVQSGYTLLEQPIFREGRRVENYPHAYTEPVFSPIRLCTSNKIVDRFFWHNKLHANGMVWCNDKYTLSGNER